MDIVSLYTTAPAHPAIDIISKHIISKNLNYHNLKATDIHQLLSIIVDKTSLTTEIPTNKYQDYPWDPVLYSHNQLYIYMRKHSQHNNDERIHFFRKIYFSHFIRNGSERVTKGLYVRCELETEQTATYWPPVPLSSFSFCWAAQSGVLRAHSPLLGAGSLYCILSSTN